MQLFLLTQQISFPWFVQSLKVQNTYIQQYHFSHKNLLMKRSLFYILCSMWATVVLSQTGNLTGAVINDFPLKKVLNASYSSTSFYNIKKTLTIVDFFGTWCVPCIKALPQLAEVQQKYPEQVQIILVSVEAAEKLKKFIDNRKNFSFPLVLDEDNALTNLFQPPSYPFTVVLNEKGTVLAQLTDAAQLTDDAIKNWLTDPEKKTWCCGSKQ